MRTTQSDERSTWLPQFLRNSGERPFRELVGHHLERQSATQLRRAASWETSQLPGSLQPLVVKYVDDLNAQLLVRRDFWQTSTCRDAVNAILGVCNETFGLSFKVPVDDAKMPVAGHDLAFALIQLATLNFAYNAVGQPTVREFMGIRRKFPWPSTVALLYPFVAGISIYQEAAANAHPSSGLTALGYGLANLGYLLAASGLLFGRFGAFRLRSRRATLGVALAAFLVGTLITNLSFP